MAKEGWLDRLTKNMLKVVGVADDYAFLMMSIIGFICLGIITVLSFTDQDSYRAVYAGMFFVLVCIAMTGLVIKRGMKYAITTKGVSIEYDVKGDKQEGDIGMSSMYGYNSGSTHDIVTANLKEDTIPQVDSSNALIVTGKQIGRAHV